MLYGVLGICVKFLEITLSVMKEKEEREQELFFDLIYQDFPIEYSPEDVNSSGVRGCRENAQLNLH